MLNDGPPPQARNCDFPPTRPPLSGVKTSLGSVALPPLRPVDRPLVQPLASGRPSSHAERTTLHIRTGVTNDPGPKQKTLSALSDPSQNRPRKRAQGTVIRSKTSKQNISEDNNRPNGAVDHAMLNPLPCGQVWRILFSFPQHNSQEHK